MIQPGLVRMVRRKSFNFPLAVTLARLNSPLMVSLMELPIALSI